MSKLSRKNESIPSLDYTELNLDNQKSKEPA